MAITSITQSDIIIAIFAMKTEEGKVNGGFTTSKLSFYLN